MMSPHARPSELLQSNNAQLLTQFLVCPVCKFSVQYWRKKKVCSTDFRLLSGTWLEKLYFCVSVHTSPRLDFKGSTALSFYAHCCSVLRLELYHFPP
jgi:hypothetical protein